jgi:hypothetical protein
MWTAMLVVATLVVAISAALSPSPATAAVTTFVPPTTTTTTTTTTTPAAAVRVEGTWSIPGGLEVVEQSQTGNRVHTTYTGTMVLAGDQTGVATLEMDITTNLKSGTFQGEATSTFTGSVAGLGDGTLRRSLRAHGVRLEGIEDIGRWNNRIVDGTGDLADARGAVDYVGQFGETGGSGTYQGHIVVPASAQTGE